MLLQTMAMQRVLAKFGIAEIVRTGKISLKRGDHLLEMGGWGDGVERRSKLEKLQRHLQEQQAQQAAAAEQQSQASQRGGIDIDSQSTDSQFDSWYSFGCCHQTAQVSSDQSSYCRPAREEVCWLLFKWSPQMIPSQGLLRWSPQITIHWLSLSGHPSFCFAVTEDLLNMHA